MAPGRAVRPNTRSRKQSLSSSIDELAPSTSELLASPTKSNTKQTPTPRAKKRVADPQSLTKELVFESPTADRRSNRQAPASPWRIKVTVQAGDDASLAASAPSNMTPAPTKVPLNDLAEDGSILENSKKSKRPRRRKRNMDSNEAEDQLISQLSQDESAVSSAKRPRIAPRMSDAGTTPGASKKRLSGLSAEPLSWPATDDQSGDAAATSAPRPLRKRIDFSQMTRSGQEDTGTVGAGPISPTHTAQGPPQPSPAPATEEEEFAEIEREAEAEAELEQSVEDDNTVEYDDEMESAAPDDDPDMDNSTAAIERSLAESEGFTMVSLNSLRNQQAVAEPGGSEQPVPPPQTSTADLHDSSIPRARHVANHTPRLSKSPSVPPSVHSSPERRSVPRKSPAAEEAGAALQKAVNDASSDEPPSRVFDAFGAGTKRDLRHGLMIGELLSRSERPSSTKASSAEGNAPSELSSSHASRLPTPADSNQDSSSSSVRSYDAMSWKPSTLPRQVGSTRSYDGSKQGLPRPKSRLDRYENLEADPMDLDSSTANSKPPEAELIDHDDPDQGSSIEDSMAPQQHQHQQRAGIKQPSVSYPSLGAQARQAAQSQRRAIQPFNNAAPSPIPSLRDLLPDDDRPTRSKIPRTWRRISGENSFLYSDETESPQAKQDEPPKKAAFRSPGAFFEDMASSVPSIFKRWGNRAVSDGVTAKSRPAETQEAEEHRRRSTPSSYRGALKGILSSPQRRAASPAKEVHWVPDHDLEDVTDHPGRDEQGFSSGSESPSSELDPDSERDIDDIDVMAGGENEADKVNDESRSFESFSQYPSSPPLPSSHRNTYSQGAMSKHSSAPEEDEPRTQDSDVDSSEVRRLKRSLGKAIMSSRTDGAGQQSTQEMRKVGDAHSGASSSRSSHSADKPRNSIEKDMEIVGDMASVGASSSSGHAASQSPPENLQGDPPSTGGSHGRSAFARSQQPSRSLPAEAQTPFLHRLYGWVFAPTITTPIHRSNPFTHAAAQQADESDVASPVRPELGERLQDSPLPKQGPHEWTPNHRILLRHYLFLWLHNQGIRFPPPDGRLVDKPSGPKMNAAVSSALKEMPEALTGYIGRELTVECRCPRHSSWRSAWAAFADLIAALNPVGREAVVVHPNELHSSPTGSYLVSEQRRHTHKITEGDARVAWAFAVELYTNGVPLIAYEVTPDTISSLAHARKTIGPSVYPTRTVGWRGDKIWVTGPIREPGGQVARVKEDWLCRRTPGRWGYPGSQGQQKAAFGVILARIAELWADGEAFSGGR